MSNRLNQQLITYFLSLIFILNMENSFETRNKHYVAAPHNLFVKLVQPIQNEPSKKVTNRETNTTRYEDTAEHLNIHTNAYAIPRILNVINKGNFLDVFNDVNINGSYTKIYADNSKKIAQVETLSIKSTPVDVAVKPTSKVKSDSGLIEANIEEILKGTSLADHGLEKAILEIEEEFGINAYFTIAVMKLESGNGKSRLAQDKNNLFGLNAIDGDVHNRAFSFKTKGDSVRKFGQLISKNYLDKGYTTIEKVSSKYCQANPKWSGVVKGIMNSDYSKL